MYLPPSLNVAQVGETINALNECIDRLKTKYIDPIIIVGGDFNRKNLSPFLSASPELAAIAAGPTRNGTALDEMYTNISRSIVQKEILPPLCKEDGTNSDHQIIAASAEISKNRKNIMSSFTFRPLTKNGTEKFKSLLLNTDWKTIQKPSSSESAFELTILLTL